MEEQQGVDAFFTMPEVAAFCVEKVKEAGWLTKETRVLEPSSGDGVFLKFIPNLVCMDLCPKHPEAQQQDFLLWTPAPGDTYQLIIGNPPFGRGNSLATPFINKAVSLCNRVAFILPKSYKRPATIDKIDPYFWPVQVHELSTDKFRVGSIIKKVQCSFFMWERREEKRPLFKEIVDIKTEPRTAKTIEEAEYIIRRAGGGAGKIITKEQYCLETSLLLVGRRNKFETIDWSSILANGGAGQKSLSMTDIHLAFKMMDMGLDYKQGAIGYLHHILNRK